mmetsp:Transcript_7227/g.21999  ORF Transcript_7227/g.21999 Transcript_7227/m.21999 type:complete len:227 (-) Transcript_7227:570-1250(-)
MRRPSAWPSNSLSVSLAQSSPRERFALCARVAFPSAIRPPAAASLPLCAASRLRAWSDRAPAHVASSACIAAQASAWLPTPASARLPAPASARPPALPAAAAAEGPRDPGPPSLPSGSAAAVVPAPPPHSFSASCSRCAGPGARIHKWLVNCRRTWNLTPSSFQPVAGAACGAAGCPSAPFGRSGRSANGGSQPSGGTTHTTPQRSPSGRSDLIYANASLNSSAVG